jgi:hypothetical protein
LNGSRNGFKVAVMEGSMTAYHQLLIGQLTAATDAELQSQIDAWTARQQLHTEHDRPFLAAACVRKIALAVSIREARCAAAR